MDKPEEDLIDISGTKVQRQFLEGLCDGQRYICALRAYAFSNNAGDHQEALPTLIYQTKTFFVYFLN